MVYWIWFIICLLIHVFHNDIIYSTECYDQHETLTLLKEGGIIKQNLLLSKNQKQAITTASNWENILASLPTTLIKLWTYQLLPFIVSSGHFMDQERNSWSGILLKCWSGILFDQEFYSWLGIQICKSAWSIGKFVRKFLCFSKNESCFGFTKGLFSREWKFAKEGL